MRPGLVGDFFVLAMPDARSCTCEDLDKLPTDTAVTSEAEHTVFFASDKLKAATRSSQYSFMARMSEHAHRPTNPEKGAKRK